MFSDKKGFLLTDALISTLIVSLMCFLVYDACAVHVKTQELLRRERLQLAEEAEEAFRRFTVCEACRIEEDPDSF